MRPSTSSACKTSMVNVLGQQPRYMQLAQTLINEIQSGRFPVGSTIPTEFELCEQFGASRSTVREAVKQLVQLGMVVRQAGHRHDRQGGEVGRRLSRRSCSS